jgi:hypothetical protein
VNAHRLTSLSLSGLLAAATIACSGNEASRPGSQAGATGGSGNTASGGSGNADPGGTGAAGAGTVGTGGSNAGTGGAGGQAALCTTATSISGPSIVNFETYDGMLEDIYSFQYYFGDANPGTGSVLGGVYAYDDDDPDVTQPELRIVAGRDASSNWALQQSVAQASNWGSGVGFWFGCVNASSFSGITFWARGETPPGTFSVSVSDGSPEGSVPTVELTITLDWQQFSIAWADFTPAPNTSTISGINIGLNLTWVEEPVGSGTWVPVPGAQTFVIDDVAFMP